jgi:oxygen-independent coproporphyrinogen-3 oxidase
MDISDLIASYDQRVPRYTSYPTAPQFSAAIDGETYATWLRQLPADTALSLYLHVPFCAQLCLFCGCHTAAVHRPEPVVAYARTLIAEIDLLADTIGRRLTVRHIHWGGGTPTALPPAWMEAIAARLRDRFHLQPDTEMAVEIDPRTLDDASLAGLARIGTTRASLGVQDFDPVVQREVGRIQSFETTETCAANIRAIGVGSINLDLIYGLPHQTVDGVAATVDRALVIDPDRIAVFGYAHVPWMKKQQALLSTGALPGPAERYAQREAAEAVITGAGYDAIGLDHFARPDDALAIAARTGRLRRNFQGYTADDAPVLLGLGASSIGSLPQGYVQNAPGVPGWREAIQAGRLPTARGFALGAEDRLRRAVIERIMCDFVVDLAAVAAQHDADPATLMDAAPALQAMARDGLIEWSGYDLAVTNTGRPFVRGVAAAFDTYLQAARQAGTARHSATV